MGFEDGYHDDQFSLMLKPCATDEELEKQLEALALSNGLSVEFKVMNLFKGRNPEVFGDLMLSRNVSLSGDSGGVLQRLFGEILPQQDSGGVFKVPEALESIVDSIEPVPMRW